MSCVRFCRLFLVAVLCGGFSSAVIAQAQGEHHEGDYTVYHTVFNTLFLKPDVAAAYGLTRGEELFLVNVSVNRTGQMHGRKAAVSGTAKNLIQQQKTLKFREVDEGEAVYYLAPVRAKGEEVLHFALQIAPTDGDPFTVNFTHKLISE